MASKNHLERICGRFRRQIFTLLLEYGVLRFLFLCLFLLLALIGADAWFRFSPDGRLVALLALIATSLLCAYFDFFRPFRGTWGDGQILTFLDRSSIAQNDSLSVLRDLQHPERMREYDSPEGKAIINNLVIDLEKNVETLDIRGSLRKKPVARWRWAAGVLMTFFVFCLFAPMLKSNKGEAWLGIGIKRILMPYATIYWPQNTRILVEAPTDARWLVPEGETLEIIAKIDGEVPTSIDISYRDEDTSHWITERMKVDPNEAVATFTFGGMSKPLTFYCAGGDDFEHRKYAVAIAKRPILTAIKATYTYPKYTMEPTRIQTSGQVAALEGTEIQLELAASMPIEKAHISFALDGADEGIPIKLSRQAEDKFSHSFRLSKSGQYTVTLIGENGLANGKPERYEIRVEPDKPPEVTLQDPAADMILTVQGKVEVNFKAEDDFNLNELQVMLAEYGTNGQALSTRITGPFWKEGSAFHPHGNGRFELDFKKENGSQSLENWQVKPGVDLELWVRAVDCNPNEPGVVESSRIRLSILSSTDFLEAIVLMAKDLMLDAHTGWHAAARGYHDTSKWLQAKQAPNKGEEDLEQALEDLQMAERAALALSQRFPDIEKHMLRNRMYKAFMGKRLDKISSAIHELQKQLPGIGEKISAGRPASAAEDTPAGRRAKMKAAMAAVLPEINEAAWRFKLIYNRFADWVALQSVLQKSLRIEELQTETNLATQQLAKHIIALELQELDDDQVRSLKNAASMQRTVFEMEETVEKELATLLQQAERDGRRKIGSILRFAFRELRTNRINDILNRTASAIGEARVTEVKRDQLLILKTMETLNKRLMRAGEEVPEDSPVSGNIPDPRALEKTKPIPDPGNVDPYDRDDPLSEDILKDALKDSLEAALDDVISWQEEVLNRTHHVQGRRDRVESPSKRYLRLLTGLTTMRQAKALALLNVADSRIANYGKPAVEKDEAKSPPAARPDILETRKRISAQLKDLAYGGTDALTLLEKTNFNSLTSSLQDHLRRGALDLRFCLAGEETFLDIKKRRKASGFKDSFGRLFLAREKNLEVIAAVGRQLQWAYLLQESALRGSRLLVQQGQRKKVSDMEREMTLRIRESVEKHAASVSKWVSEIHEQLNENISDPKDPEESNQKIFPALKEYILDPLPPSAFQEAQVELKESRYEATVQKQIQLRNAIGKALISLKDILDERVKAKEEVADWGPAGLLETEPGVIEYAMDQPDAIAERLEGEGQWLDELLGTKEPRLKLIKQLRERKRFHSKYGRLQSQYFQALSQHFQAKNVTPERATKNDAGGEVESGSDKE